MAPRKKPMQPPKAVKKPKIEYKVNWKERGALGAVRDQGDCACCWAIVICLVIESLRFIMKLDCEIMTLSPQDLIYSCKKPDDREGNDAVGCYFFPYKNAFKYVKNNGVMFEKDCKFTKGREKRYMHKRKGQKAYIDGYDTIDDGDEKKLEEVVKIHPVPAAMRCYDELLNYNGGIYKGEGYKENKQERDQVAWHGVLVVGYGHEGGNQFWLVMSSWSDTWGEKGFARIARNCPLLKGRQEPLLNMMVYPIINKEGHDRASRGKSRATKI